MSIKQDEPSQVETAGSEAKRPQDWSPKERMRFVLEADGLGDQELGELIRRRGVRARAPVPETNPGAVHPAVSS